LALTLLCKEGFGETAQLVPHEKPKTLYFFSSWCPACLPGLKEADPKTTLFVPFQDDPEKACATLARYNPEGTCKIDTEGKLATQYSIREIPCKIEIVEKTAP